MLDVELRALRLVVVRFHLAGPHELLYAPLEHALRRLIVRASGSGSVPLVEPPVVFFDGPCVLCNRSVAFLVSHDHDARLRFAPLQGEFARRVLPRELLDSGPEASFVLLEPGKPPSTRSRAVLRILTYLGPPWSFAHHLQRIPGMIVLLDRVYRAIARNRDRWFGRYRECPLPDPELRARLIE